MQADAILFSQIINEVSSIRTICENAQYNRNICNSLYNIVASTIDKLKLENKIFNKEHNQYFIPFLKNARVFIENVSKLEEYLKINDSNEIQILFSNIIIELKASMEQLNFQVDIPNCKNILERDISGMDKFLIEIKDIESLRNRINDLIEIIKKSKDVSLQNINLNLKFSSDVTVIDKTRYVINEIVPTELTDPSIPLIKEKNHIVIKKVYGNCEVACKQISINHDKEIQTNRAILVKLQTSPNILKFYGTYINENCVTVVSEWVELGSLKEVYENGQIRFDKKIQIATKICRGIMFLHTCTILHHDIRCENILITKNFEPKITNFEYSRFMDREKSISFDELLERVRWAAPEKLKHTNLHTSACDIFRHVLAGKRENLKFELNTEEIKDLQCKYTEIIESAWRHDLNLRENFWSIFLRLSSLENIKLNCFTEIPEYAKVSEVSLKDDSTNSIEINEHSTYNLPVAVTPAPSAALAVEIFKRMCTNTNPSEIKYSERAWTALENNHIKTFDSSKFSIIKEIGRGGFGVVYLAMHCGITIAVKRLFTYDDIKSFVNEKWDIYSLGALFWKLTSGIPPFANYNDVGIILLIRANHREKPIPNTPPSYVDLYQKCWDPEPKRRPTIDEIEVKLERLLNEDIEFIENCITRDSHKEIPESIHNSGQDQLYLSDRINKPKVWNVAGCTTL
ncbi:40732_t:CDS:2 [Gigaspora margarita]|uniref:40732_t:CDS:1 n=1 Tax=Gigaspora margarita TaxID=4874 RepID=A0ABN7UFJ5_GIGMA|nr:40732_t:CDS:2 [Gigaspora margarita]